MTSFRRLIIIMLYRNTVVHREPTAHAIRPTSLPTMEKGRLFMTNTESFYSLPEMLLIQCIPCSCEVSTLQLCNVCGLDQIS